MTGDPVFEFALRMGDNCLVLGQSNSAWCGHAPILEEDIALANVSLDLIGQAKLWLSLAAELQGEDKSADDIAFLRDVREFRNCLLVEQPNGDYAQTLMRQFLFDAWHLPMLTALVRSTNVRISEVAEKSVKEAAYHLERSTDLVIRLGDGNDESRDRMQSALKALWRFTGELTTPDDVDQALQEDQAAPDLDEIAAHYEQYTQRVLREATLVIPDVSGMQIGGKSGLHTEGLGFLLAEMQSLQRMYPGASW